MPLLFLFVMLALMWAFVIRPQQRKVKEHRAFVAGLSVGDEVVTTAGMYGTITDLSDQRVRLEIAPGVEITMARLAIGHHPHAVETVESPDDDSTDPITDPTPDPDDSSE